MTVLSLEEVRVEPDAALVAAGISRPAAGEAVGAPTFVVRGWALSGTARALAVEIRAGGRLLRVAPVREPTPEIASAYPDRPRAAHCGFLTRVHVRGLEAGTELRLDAVLANGTRAAVGTIAIARSEPRPRTGRAARGVPSLRPDVERLLIEQAERLRVEASALLETPDVPALDDIDLKDLAVLDLSGGPGHVARAARARGAVLVDSVHLADDLATVARLLDLYHRTTRVFVHESLEGLDRTYDVVLMLGGPPPLAFEDLEALTAGAVLVR